MRFNILITAGPTAEHIDPIRFISNYSTGTFGYEIAREGLRRGNRVVLVSGPTTLTIPRGARFIRAESAVDMRKAVLKEFKGADCVIMASAVSDWRPAVVAKRKIKRKSGKLTLKLVPNPDILAELGRKKESKVLVGFALETENLEENARRKLKEKKLDLIIANRSGGKSPIFGYNLVDVLMVDRLGQKILLRHKSKRELAKIILDKVEELTL